MPVKPTENRRAADETHLRESVIQACIQMNQSGINQGTSGNISVRFGEGMLITPTSIPYENLHAEDIVWMGFNGDIKGDQKPSSEWHFHLDIMRKRSDVNAVVHAHPTYCTTLAILEKEIPPIHYMIAVAAGGPNIRCAPYATFGTEELSQYALTALEGRNACLLAHHGMIAVSTSLDKAMWVAEEVETLAKQYHGCIQVISEPPLLSEEEIDRVLEKVNGYGYSKS